MPRRISRLHHEPQFLDKVWDEARSLRGEQPNGYVFRVVKTRGQIDSVIVKFYDSSKTKNEYKNYQPEALMGNWRGMATGFQLHARVKEE